MYFFIVWFFSLDSKTCSTWWKLDLRLILADFSLCAIQIADFLQVVFLYFLVMYWMLIWRQLSEYQIIEIAENVCNLKKREADWILKIDIVERGDKLEVKRRYIWDIYSESLNVMFAYNLFFRSLSSKIPKDNVIRNAKQ